MLGLGSFFDIWIKDGHVCLQCSIRNPKLHNWKRQRRSYKVKDIKYTTRKRNSCICFLTFYLLPFVISSYIDSMASMRVFRKYTEAAMKNGFKPQIVMLSFYSKVHTIDSEAVF